MRTLILLFALALCAFAQTNVPVQDFPGVGREVETEVALPTDLTVVISQDAWVRALDITNDTDASATFTVCNNETSAKCRTITIAARTWYVISFPNKTGRKFTKGLKWNASTSGLTAYVSAWVKE